MAAHSKVERRFGLAASQAMGVLLLAETILYYSNNFMNQSFHILK